MDDELKRLKRFIYVSWCLLLAVIIGLTVWGSVELRKLNQSVQFANARVIHGIDGSNGTNGASIIGPEGPSGRSVAGKDGQSITSDQIASAVASYLTLNPPAAGQPGTPGNDGLTLEVQVTAGCQLQSKYSDSDVWTPLAQLILPCGILNE